MICCKKSWRCVCKIEGGEPGHKSAVYPRSFLGDGGLQTGRHRRDELLDLPDFRNVEVTCLAFKSDEKGVKNRPVQSTFVAQAQILPVLFFVRFVTHTVSELHFFDETGVGQTFT